MKPGVILMQGLKDLDDPIADYSSAGPIAVTGNSPGYKYESAS